MNKFFKGLTIVLGIITIIVLIGISIKGELLIKEGIQQKKKSGCLIGCLQVEKETNPEWFEMYRSQVLRDCAKRCKYK